MKLLRFKNGAWGVESPLGIYDISHVLGNSSPDFAAIAANWPSLKERIVEQLPRLSPLTTPPELDCPIPSGGKLLCIGLNYRDHALESGMDIPSEPVVFNKLAGCLCGPECVVPLPACSQQVDYEAELVIVIGTRAWQVSESDAEQHILGYTCGHDVSARDWQLGRPGGQWLLGKSFPNFAPVGPAIVPKEFLGDPQNLSISLRVNGETLQDSSTREFIYSPSQLVSFLSGVTVLEPGDIIFTGTPPGVGMARKPQRFLRAGDIAEVEIAGIGVLRNRFE
ncbi:MAG: fumarylacetoacetate hydrolase family protein [Pirellulaceae bacterium]